MQQNQSPSEPLVRSARRALQYALPLGLILFAGDRLTDKRGRQELKATGAWSIDSDGDGLPDAQELVLGTSPTLTDTDGDGFSDTFEFASQSSPLSGISVPTPLDVSVGMSARGGAGTSVKMLVGVYTADGVLDDEAVRFGKVQGGLLLSVPFDWILARSHMRAVPIEGGGTVTLIEITLPRNQISCSPYVSYFTAVGLVGQPYYQSAAVADFTHRAGIPLLKMQQFGGGAGGGASQTQAAGGSVYRPIPGDSSTVPDGWSPGQICYRTSETVAVAGAVVTQEVTTAECQDGWDSYCASGCENSVGQTYDTVDPLALVGG